MKVKNPSLELNWLKYPKDVSIPDIVVIGEDDYAYAGCYYEPEEDAEIYVDDKPYGLERGILLIREDQFEPTIVHEFRHHLQTIHFGWKPEGHDFDFDNDYKDSIIKYFTTNKFEMDALLYELKYYPTDVNLEWMEWITKHYENLCIDWQL